MTDKDGTSDGEQDDISFLRTGDIIAMTCLASANREGVLGSERVCLCTEGFGNRMCSLENVSNRDLPADISMCMLYIYNALSVRALQEMMSNDNELKGTGSGGGHKTLLYGHAVQLKHVQSEMYLACLSSCSSNDKLAFDVGVQENNEGEACWWTIHPASKQRSEGEKVRVGDDVILVSVATERYLHMIHGKGFMVIASFHQTLWNITSVSSGSIRIRNMGALFGNDILRFFHGNDEVLTIPENWSEHPQHNMAIYEGGAAVSQARSLWRIELIRFKWHGALVGWEQPFRIRHITSGRYLGVMENVIQLYDKDKAEFDTTAFVMYQTKDLKKQLVEEKEEGMGVATIYYGETIAFIQHIKTELWLSYQTSEITRKGLGKVEEKKAVALKDAHMDDCFTFFMALEEESKSARVIRKCSSVLNRFLKGIEALQREGKQAQDWNRVDLNEVLKLMEDLIDYFAQPEEDDFEVSQNRLRALRSRQDLFQEEGVLNMILDTIDKFSQMEAVPDFAALLNEDTQFVWEEISTYLYLLVAAMIKGNHYNCAQFASAQRLQWLFGRLSNPQSAEGILDVLYCVLTESPEALNMINESHIKSVISLLEKVGRDPKVLDVLSSLCEGNGMAVRSSQNTITQHLLPGKDLLLQTKMRDHVSSMTPNILVGVVEGSSQFRRWYYEAEVEHIEQMTNTKPYLRIGWANSMGYKPFPGSGDGWGCIGIGDDYYSYGFDGQCIYCATKKHVIWTRTLQKGDVVGCLLDLNIPEISFTVNGQSTAGLFKNFNIDGFFFPVMSLSAKVSCRFMFGGTEGRLRFGPPPGFSPLIEAVANQLEIGECLSFGDIAKNVYTGPSILRQNTELFVPVLVDISNVVLPEFAMEIHEKLAENLHELWAMRKIELGWSYGEVRDEKTRRHPCLTSFQQLPQNEKTYNINLAIDTMKTIEALRYHLILDEPGVRMRHLHLPQNYQQSNGFKPQPLDSHEIILDDNVFPLIDALAKNTHNVWAREKIRRGWTFGLNEFLNMNQKRTPHLVPYEVVDQRIKEANRESATEFVKALQLFGIFLEPPVLEHDEGAEKELKATRAFSRTYRAEAIYAVSSGKWYFEFEVLTSGFMKVGWMDVSASSTFDIGKDDRSYGFDGYLARKWHQGSGTYGREWKIGDIVGAFLDLSDHTISFSLNGELLLDPSGSEMAFDNVLVTDGFVPAMTFSAGQKARLNFGQDSNSLKYFTTCGLQEGYEPFCVNMYRQMPMWYAKRLPQFEDIGLNSTIEVSRIPATGNSPPCLKITQKQINTGDITVQEKAKMEYIRLSLPVKCNDKLQQTKDKESIMRSVQEIEKQHLAEEVQSVTMIKHPAIPREFGDDTKVNKKKLGRSLLSAFKHSTEEDENLARSKPISFENDQLLESSTIRMSGSMLELSSNDEHRVVKHKRGGLMARLHQRKNEIKRTLADGHPVNADAISAESMPPSILKDDQDMPRSGPGRYRRLMSGKSKKNKLEKQAFVENRRPSIAALDQSVTVEGNVPNDDMRAMIELSDKIDEFYYAIRIFPGQDPANVWVGWVTPKYHFYAERFIIGEAVRICKYQEMNKNVNEGESLEYRNCYIINAAELLQSVSDAGNTKVSGLLIGCIIDTSIGELSFLVSNQDTGFRFKLEPGAILYPAAFVAPTSAEVLQFELGRIKYTFPLSSAMFKSSHKSLLSFCPPRLTVEKLNPVHWARVPTECLRTTALKLSDSRGWSVLCDDPVRIMSIYVPEKDTSYDILEMIERNDFLVFHRQTLNLYCKLAAHGNQKVAHILCSHVDEDQIMYAVKSHYLSGPLRQGFHDFLIAVHLRTYVDARQSTSHEYVIPLTQSLEIKNVFQPENESRFPQILGPTISIRPVTVRSEVCRDSGTDAESKLLPPAFNFAALKTYVMSALSSATEHAVINCRDLIGGNCLNHFEPLFKLFNSLLVIGIFDDDDMKDVLKLIHPIAFDENYVPGSKQKGLTEIELAEGVKIQLTMILENICDVQLRHRVESLISFAAGFVGDLQQDQFSRYMSIKQTDMSPAEAAKRTKEFRCPPREQMFRLMKCKAVSDDSVGIMLDDETEYDQCPMDEKLQQQLREFCSLLVSKIGCIKNEERNELSELVVLEEANSWVDQLAQLVIRVPPPLAGEDNSMNRNGTENFRHTICKMLKSWATSSMIESNELIRKMFSLLLRQYNGITEMMKALSQTYVLHERNIEDVQDFIENLVQVRELVSVQFQNTEEAVLKRGLWKLMNNRIFFQHPDLMRLLTVHENVMSIMMNVLTAQQGAADHGEHAEHIENTENIAHAQESKNASEMVVACSRFLCYFCRTSRHNQKAMFEHLSFLLDNASMLLARPSLRGSVPLDIAYSSFMDNSELALALKEEELDKVTVYLSRCGLQPNLELIAKGYPDIGWDPVEGERYIDFLRFCVWINGESVEANANLVIRLLIRRPECLGVALKGEGQGLFSAFKEAIALSEDIRALEEDKNRAVVYSALLREQPHYPNKEAEGEDYVDLGAATLDFYSSLVDLLAKCAPDKINIQAGKGDCVRARAILRSLISMDDLGQILALRFTIPNLIASKAIDDEPLPGLLPNHKQSVLLFLDRVYGIDSQEMFFHFLEKSFLPDLRAATMMDSPCSLESDTALALNRYLCNAVLPLLTNHSNYFANAEHHAALLDTTLHTVYSMNHLQSLTKNQRDAVSDFLVAITHELPPAMLVKFMRKVITDIQEMNENLVVPLRILTLHYERCTKYYGLGNIYGMASEVEKRLSMLLFYAIFDSLGSRPYDPELFGKALPCLTAIGSAISPDYTLTTTSDTKDKIQKTKDHGVWNPDPVDVSGIYFDDDLLSVITKFAEHFHDSWASRKIEKGWNYGELYSRQALTHPRLKPFALLPDFEKNFYQERCAECLRALLVWNYSIELADRDAAERAAQNNISLGTSIENFNPRPVDLSNMTLEKDMMGIAEKMAEESHKIWAKKVFADLSRGGSMPPQLVPWDLLTDFERRKDRFRAAEILKFLQYYGYRVWSSNRIEPSAERIKIDSERSSVEKRFAYNLLKKLTQYLEQAFLKMKTIKPSQELTRQNSFKKESQDVKFFEKVVLPLMHVYFNAHKNYFLASSSIVQTGMASDKEKEMVANLFCRLASLLRIKNHAFGSVAKITVRCLQGLTQALDLRTLVKINSDILRTGLLTFFNNCADDLFSAVEEVQSGGQYSLLRGQNLKSWVSLEFANQVIIPVLTTMFVHLAENHFGSDLLLDEIQAACYKILDSAYLMNNLAAATSQRKSIAYEMDKHRPALGQCLAAFAGCFPVAFLEDKFNKSNKYSLMAKSQEQSVQVQEMLQNLLAHIPQLDKLLTDVEQVGQSGIMYRDQPAIYDVDLPLICSYLTYWWQFGPDSNNKSTVPITDVNSEYINRIFRALLQMIRNHIGVENASWLCRINFFSVQIIPYVSCDMVKDDILPIAESLRCLAEKAYKEEEYMRTHPDDADEGTVAEDNAHLVRDVYAYFPILMKYTDLHRAQWLKSPSWETDGIYENVAIIFKIWSLSQHFKREELNFMAQYEDESIAGSTVEMKTGKAAIAERKKKRREGQIRKDKHAGSIVIACLKRLLPVGLNVFGGRELDIVQQAKEKFLAKESEEKIRELVRSLLDVPAKTDPTDKNAWQLNLYRKIGKSQMRNKNVMTLEGIVEKITSMGQVVAILHVTEHPQGSMVNAWKTMLSSQRKRAVVACFRMIPLYGIPRHRAINFFLPAFNKLWLEDEDVGQDALIKELTLADETQEQLHSKSGDEEVLIDEKDEKFQASPDPLRQLIQCFQHAATSEQSQTISIANDSLFVNFAQVMSKSVHIEDEDEADENEGELDQAQKEEKSQALRAEQAVLADRGAAIMCLMYLSASNGEPSDMVAEALQLGIHLLNGGNSKIQEMLIDYLQLKKDVRFFVSLAGLMNKCSVLNLEMYERQIKAEGLGMGAELASAANQNLNDSEFTCSLFRFLQLTCEGHNLEFQNYLRTQPGHTTSVNLINCTVDYLLRLQESVMDFYWHYSSKDVIDESGKEYFLRAIHVCSQVFNTLTESIQGPCTGNQMTLANSRLWDAINGFFFLFAHMMEKLYKNSTQLELLREFLNLQKDMIVLMLSMLEGNVLNGSIGKQMVDALVESEQNVEMILKFSDMFLKLKDLTTSQAFQDFDTNRDGWISPKEFQRAMESQKMYSVEEITYLMMCTDVNNDGKVDYMEFTERFHNPARDIGFNVAVLLTNLKEHITSDPRLEKIIKQASSLLEYFDPFLGRIEIMGSSKKVEKIYFEIQESWLEQWSKQQIRDSKNSFLFNVLQDDGGDQGKLEAFINFCEDTIFEMQHAAEISAGDVADSKIERAKKQRDYFLQQTSAGAQISATFKTGFIYGVNAANALKPANVKRIFNSANDTLKSMTWAQLIFAIVTLSIKASVKVAMFIYLIICTLFRFGYYLMTPDRDDLEVEQVALPMPESADKQYTSPVWPSFQQSHRSGNYDVFGVQLPSTYAQTLATPMGQSKSEVTNAPSPIQQSEAILKPPTQQDPSLYETQTVCDSAYYNQVASPAVSEYGVADYYEPKIAEQISLRSRGSLLNMLARNFKAIEKTTLYLAFFINVILLFHRIKIAEDVTPADEDMESVYISGVVLPYTSYEITGWMLAQLLYWISVLHAVASFALLVSFYQLKIPLITFKREKEVARRLMFDGCWLTEDDDEERSLTNTVFWYIDRIVISSKSFPMKYWDKFVRRKTRQKFRDQIDDEILITVLGEDKSATDTAFDYRYACWLWLGVILTNGQFLYRVHYLLCSALGVLVSPFFYAFHLIDVVLSFPMLKAILQSVTHNLQQLILTIMMTLVVVYLYTVLAFNFFRKFYVQESEGEEPDRKCHNMLTCFIYHFYAGVRAGGGIGDELESPYGDDLEYWRMLYDISFFFFVIIILLAIMQGLIIDAFGELRDQQESATEKLESSCFICDIGKETFDRMPRGFEIHTSKEHNFANYLFFLQHLVNKDKTEYTGQETYVREKYDNRDWEFFPVGECFMKQYEDQLLQS